MNAKDTPPRTSGLRVAKTAVRLRRRRAGLILTCDLIVGGLVGWALAGCADHRISLHDFIEMQQNVPTEQAAVLATQPSATTQPALEELLAQQTWRYQLGPGDVVTVSVFHTEVTRTVQPMQLRIDLDGYIELPSIEPVKVAGMDLIAADKAVREALVPAVYKDVVIHVAIGEPEPTRVFVYGGVTTPGLVPLRRTERNLPFAITGAGGYSLQATGSVTLKRLRDPEREVTLNMRDPNQLRAALALEPLSDGDVISAEVAMPNTVFVGGLVNAPRPQSYPPGTNVTILQALAGSGGVRTDVFPHEATLIRHVTEGKDIQVKLNLDRLQTGKDPNIYLASGDVLWVPDTIMTRINDWCNRNLFIRAGATATYGASYNMSGVDYFNNAARNANNGTNTGGLQDTFDPFGFLLRNQSLQALQARPTATTP